MDRSCNDAPILEACASNEIHSAVSDNPNTLVEWSQSNARKKHSPLAYAAGDFNAAIPHLSISSSKPAEKVWWRSCNRNLYSSISGQRFAQLLQSPLRCRMLGRND